MIADMLWDWLQLMVQAMWMGIHCYFILFKNEAVGALRGPVLDSPYDHMFEVLYDILYDII